MPIKPALVAMTRIVKARMPTQIPDQKARGWDTIEKPVTIPATGLSFQVVARSVVYEPPAVRWTGNTLMPIVGRKADTKRTAAITANVARGTLRPGFFASSDMLEMVSMPVYE